MSRICNEKCSKLKIFWRSSQNHFVFALFSSLYSWLPFLMHLPVEKHKIIVKNCRLKYNYQ
jgi:hypothetical protein